MLNDIIIYFEEEEEGIDDSDGCAPLQCYCCFMCSICSSIGVMLFFGLLIYIYIVNP